VLREEGATKFYYNDLWLLPLPFSFMSVGLGEGGGGGGGGEGEHGEEEVVLAWQRLSHGGPGDNPPPRTRHCFVAVGVGGRGGREGGREGGSEGTFLVLFGGREGRRAMGDAWVFDLRYGDNRWTKVPTNGRTRPPPRWGHAACAVEGGREGGKGRVVVVGGVEEDWGGWVGAKEGDAWVLDVETLRWQELKVTCRKKVEGENWERSSIFSSPACSFPEGRGVRMLLSLPCLSGLVLGLWVPWREEEGLGAERVLILDTRDGRWEYLNARRGGRKGVGLGLWRRRREADAGRIRREKARRRMDPDKEYGDSDYYDSEEDEEEELEEEEVGQPAVATAAMVGLGHLVVVRATRPRRARLLRWVLPHCVGVMYKEEIERGYERLQQRELPTWIKWTDMPVVLQGEGGGVNVEEEQEEEWEEEEEGDDEEEDYEDDGQHDPGARQRMVIVSVVGGDVCMVGPGAEEWEMVAGECK